MGMPVQWLDAPLNQGKVAGNHRCEAGQGARCGRTPKDFNFIEVLTIRPKGSPGDFRHAEIVRHGSDEDLTRLHMIGRSLESMERAGGNTLTTSDARAVMDALRAWRDDTRSGAFQSPGTPVNNNRNILMWDGDSPDGRFYANLMSIRIPSMEDSIDAGKACLGTPVRYVYRTSSYLSPPSNVAHSANALRYSYAKITHADAGAQCRACSEPGVDSVCHCGRRQGLSHVLDMPSLSVWVEPCTETHNGSPLLHTCIAVDVGQPMCTQG